MILLKTSNLSPAERAFAWRKMHGLTIVQAAAKIRVGKTQYFDMEHGTAEAPTVKLPDVLPMPIQQRLLRQRCGWSLNAISRRAGVSHVTFLRAERSGTLVEFWKKQIKQRVKLAGKR